MGWIISEERLTVEEVADFFDNYNQEYTSVFNESLEDGTLITLKDMFISHYHGRKCRYKKTPEDRKKAKHKFHTIFIDNMFLLSKYRTYKEQVFSELHNFELMRDETISEYSSEYDNTTTSKGSQNITNVNTRDLVDGNLVGSSDASNLSTIRDNTNRVIEAKKLMEKSKDKVLDWLDPNTKQVTQTISMYKGTDTFKNDIENEGETGVKGSGKGGNKVFVSNPFKDRITFLGLNNPNLISEYLNVFQIMFHC